MRLLHISSTKNAVPSARMRQFACLAVLLLALPAQATEWKETQEGQPLPDAEVSIGRFKVKLPAGSWHVLAKGSDRVSGWSGAAPVFLSLAVAQVEGGTLRAALHLVAPGQSVSSVIWNDTLCQVTNPILIDTEGTSFRYPECLHVTALSTKPWQEADGKAYFNRVLKSLERLQVQAPEQLYQVLYMRAYRADNLRVQAFFPQKDYVGNTEALITWGKSLRSVVRPLVEGNATDAVIPAFPKSAP